MLMFKVTFSIKLYLLVLFLRLQSCVMESKRVLAFLLISCVVLTVLLHTTEAQIGGMRWGREFEENGKLARLLRKYQQRRTFDNNYAKGTKQYI